MRRNKLHKKITSMLLMSSMLVGTCMAASGCGSKKADEPITLNVYSQLANYSGLQTGWMGDILLKKFNVKLNIIPNSSEVFETRMETGNLGDIIIWGNNPDQYAQAVKGGYLYDLEEDDLITTEGKYISDHMSEALEKNKELTSSITDNKKKTLYGWGHDVGTSADKHAAFNYSWDIRWDLYKKLGYPTVKNLDDLENLLIDMQKADPTDDSGNKTYAVSLWPDWDDAMVMYVKSMASAYYGYDELGIGLYDPATGKYHGAMEENGPYLEMLQFFNKLYRDGLVDPDSMTQTYDQMYEKVQNGGVLFSIFNYAGSLGFNSGTHLEKGQYMYSMKPEEASPLVYGLNPKGGNYITSIGAKSEYPELCMEILNYFCTPEGRMVMSYGPKGECWNYDKDGKTVFTKLGKACSENSKTKMTKHKGTFLDGQMQMAVSTWSIDADNPDSNGETYNSTNWKSNQVNTKYDIEKDWVDYTKCDGANEYLEKGKYTMSPATSYSVGTKSQELSATWNQVTDEITNSSWKAIYAKSDKDFQSIVDKMKKTVNSYGYDKCLKWSEKEADARRALEKEATK